MGFTEQLRLLVAADTKGAVAEVEKLGAASARELSKSEKALDQWGHRLTKAGTAMIGVGSAALVGLGAMARASEEANLAQVKLDNTIQNMPKLAGASKGQFVDLAESIQKVTAADADAIVEGQALLGTFNLTAQQIKGITPLVVDYARKFGVSIPDAAVQVGKALDGNIGALKRNGVSIDEVLFKTDRYRAVQEALAEQVGGFAEAEGKTFAGSLQRMRNELGDLAEGVGSGAVDAFNVLFGAVEKGADALESVSPGMQNAIGQAATFGAVGLIASGGISTLVGQIIKARDGILGFGEAVKGLSFTSLATGLGVIAPLTIGAGIALAGYNQTKAEAKRVTDGYVEALGKEVDSTRAATDKYSSAELAAGDFGSALRRSNADMDLFTRAIRLQGDELDRLGGKRDVIREQGFDAALRASGVETSALTDELGRLSGEMSKGEFDRFIKRLDALSDGYDNATEQTKNQRFAEGELADQHGETTAATDDLTESVKSYSDELKALYDPIFAAVNAQKQLDDANRDVTGAEMELAAAIRDHGEGSLEAMAATDKLREAQNRAVEAAVGQNVAIDGLRQGLQDGTIDIDEARRRLDEFVASSQVSAATAAAFRAELDQFDGRVVNVRIVTTRQDVILPGARNVPVGRQHGGSTHLGQIYRVAEQGRPELLQEGDDTFLIPGRDGRVVPFGPGAAGGAGGTIRLVIDSGSNPVDRVLADMLRNIIRVEHGGNVQAALGFSR